jgi:MFS transporter, DHA2 family, multidrug resistance protein
VWIAALQFMLDRGQEDDWLGSNSIRWACVLLVAGFIAFLVRELTAGRPLVDLCVFKDRNFAVGCLLIALFGAVIYGIVTILPLSYQTLLDYSASTAGLAVSPRGLGAVLVMPIVGLLSNRLDNRWIMMCGFGLFAITAARMGHLTLQISPWSLAWAIVLSGSAAGMVFVPLSTTTMGTLANEQIGNGSGLFNLLRNVGGSVGISVVDTLIARRQQVHRAELSRYTSPSPVFQHAYHTYYGQMAQHGGPHAAMLRAYAG